MNVLSFIKFNRYASLEQLCMILCIIYKWVIFIAFSFLRVWDRVFFLISMLKNTWKISTEFWKQSEIYKTKGTIDTQGDNLFSLVQICGLWGGGGCSLYFLNLERTITLDSISPLYLIKSQWIFKAYKNCTYVITWCNEAWKKMKTKNEIKY